MLRSKAFLGHVEQLSNRTNIPKVNKAQLESFSCIAPPKPLQDKFFSLVQHVEEQEKKMQKSLALLEYNLQSLLQRAFKGELSIRTEKVL